MCETRLMCISQPQSEGNRVNEEVFSLWLVYGSLQRGREFKGYSSLGASQRKHQATALEAYKDTAGVCWSGRYVCVAQQVRMWRPGELCAIPKWCWF